MIRPLAVIAALLAGAAARAETRWLVPPYTIVLDTAREEPRDDLTVLLDGRPVYHLADHTIRSDLTLGQETMADDLEQGLPGHDSADGPDHDALGLGFPNLVFAAYSGGAHCCFRAVILMFDRAFRAQTIDLYDPGGNFHAVEGRKSLVLEATDATFKEWRSSPADSPFPTVFLSFAPKTGLYAADPELMRAPVPPPEELARRQERAREDQQAMLAAHFTDYEVGALTSPMLDLVYTGHMAEAHDFLTRAWIGTAERREAYWSLLTRCKLRMSPYWPAVARINDLPADPPAGDCGRSGR